MRHHRLLSHRGFSIVEATLAVLLIGGAMVAAMNVAMTASRANGAATQRRKAEKLAHTLLAEALALPAAGTDSTNATGGARLNNFDHLQDFDGFRESPPMTIDGRACAPTGWAWEIALAARGTDTIDAQSLDLRMTRITATVELPDGTTVSVQGLRGDSTAVERVPVVDGQDIIQTLISIQLSDGASLYAAPETGTVRPPNSVQRTGVIQ